MARLHDEAALPYPANPIIWQFEHPINGKCPPFCHSPSIIRLFGVIDMDQAVATAETALIVIDEADVMSVFTGDFAEKFEPHIAHLRRIVATFQATARDAKVKADREAIKQFAFKLVKTRTAIEGQGKKLAEKLKALPKQNDDNRRRVRLAIEEMETTVRAPVDAWETEEKARIDAHVANIATIRQLKAETDASTSVEGIVQRMKHVEELTPAEDKREEFADEYRIAAREALGALGTALVARRQYEKDQADLARLRAAAQAQEAKEAAEIELRAAAERQRQEAAEKHQRKQLEAIEAAERAERAAEQRARDAIAETERIKLKAERDEAEAERQRLQTIENERIAAETKKAEEKAEADRLARRGSHRAKINNAAVAAILKAMPAYDATEEAHDMRCAKAILAAIVRGEIPNVTIGY
jgi:colicin import membrane protein